MAVSLERIIMINFLRQQKNLFPQYQHILGNFFELPVDELINNSIHHSEICASTFQNDHYLHPFEFTSEIHGKAVSTHVEDKRKCEVIRKYFVEMYLKFGKPENKKRLFIFFMILVVELAAIMQCVKCHLGSASVVWGEMLWAPCVLK